MQVTYELTERDFRDGYIAFFNSRGVLRVAKPLIVAAVVIALMLTVLSGVSRCHVRQQLMNLLPLYAVIGLWILVLFGSPWWGARRQFRNQPSAQGEKTMTVSDKGIEWQGNTGRSEAYWPMFIKWFETPTLLVLFPSTAFFYVLPKRAFTPEQLAEFRQMLERHIGPMNKQRKAAAS